MRRRCKSSKRRRENSRDESPPRSGTRRQSNRSDEGRFSFLHSVWAPAAAGVAALPQAVSGDLRSRVGSRPTNRSCMGILRPAPAEIDRLIHRATILEMKVETIVGRLLSSEERQRGLISQRGGSRSGHDFVHHRRYMPSKTCECSSSNSAQRSS